MATILSGVASRKAAKARTPQRQRVRVPEGMPRLPDFAGNEATDAVIRTAQAGPLPRTGAPAESPKLADEMHVYDKDGRKLEVRGEDDVIAKIPRPVFTTKKLIRGVDYLGIASGDWTPTNDGMIRKILSAGADDIDEDVENLPD